MKRILLTVVVLFSFASTSFAVETPQMSIYEAINRAGYQRMLTQRIAKCYLIIVTGVEVEKYKNHLAGSAKIFETNLKELSSYAPTDEIRDQFRYIDILWRNYKFIYTDEYTEENTLIILEFNDKILKACNNAVTMLENHAKGEEENLNTQEVRRGDVGLSYIINIAGRQRMLTQRLLLYSMAQAYELGDEEENKRKFLEALETFNKTYKKLMSYSKNTTDIDQQLMTVTEHWQILEENLLDIAKGKMTTIQTEERLLASLKLSEQILFAFDEIVFLYEREKKK